MELIILSLSHRNSVTTLPLSHTMTTFLVLIQRPDKIIPRVWCVSEDGIACYVPSSLRNHNANKPRRRVR